MDTFAVKQTMKKLVYVLEINGAPVRIRTSNLLIRSQLTVFLSDFFTSFYITENK